MPTKLFTNVCFSERTFDVSNYPSAISSIAFSKCTKFFNNCLIEPSLIITKSRAKLKVILSENYCTKIGNAQLRPRTLCAWHGMYT